MAGQRGGAAHVEWLFLATLSRQPTAEESAAMLKVLQEGKGQQGLEDVLWALLNSTEFTTNLYFARFPHTRTPKTAEKMRGPSNNGPFGGFGKPAQKAANP